MRKHPRTLADHLRRTRPDLQEPEQAIAAGLILVEGRVVTNPDSLVRPSHSVVVSEPTELRGEVKLRAALARFEVEVDGRVALDCGAAAGGFTRALVEAGARRVYAVDAGFGQLLGSLRQDPRVVVLESTNLGELNRGLVPDPVQVVTLDLSYLSVAKAVPQLGAIQLAPGADLIALVKPMFELGMSTAPLDSHSLDEARRRAAMGVREARWKILDWMDSPITGSKGAPELFLHARLERTPPASRGPSRETAG